MKLRNVKVKYVLCRHLGPCQWENKEKMEEDDVEKEKRRNGGNMSGSSTSVAASPWFSQDRPHVSPSSANRCYSDAWSTPPFDRSSQRSPHLSH